MGKGKAAKSASIPISLAAGSLAGILITVFICGIIAWFIYSGTISENAMNYGTTAAILCGSILCASISYGRIQGKPLWICMAAAGIYFFLLLALNILFFEGRISKVGVTALLILGGAFIPAILASRGRGGTKKKHKKVRYR